MIDLRGRRIFVVEDNLENRIITRLALVKTGVTLHFDMWGRDTLKTLAKFAPVDLVILDLMLPNGASGYQIFEELRELPEFKHVPVVAVSASDATAMGRCRERGFSGFIAKPIDDELFPGQIARLIHHEQIWHRG